MGPALPPAQPPTFSSSFKATCQLAVMRMGLIILVMAILLIGWALLRLEQGMIYHPTPLSGADPAQWGLPCETVEITSEDGERLQGWWCPRPEVSGPLLLFFHGNAGNREDRLHNLAGLWKAGFSVLIFDYRGYGGSTGTPSEQGLLADGAAAHAWLRERAPGRPILFFGRSLGGAVAAAVAAGAERAVGAERAAGADTATGAKRAAVASPAPDGLILESTFTSAREMARLMLPFPGIERLVRSRFDTLEAVGRLRLPLLIVHGTADELVPFEMGKRLFQAAASAQKKFQPVDGGRHNDTYAVAGPAYYRWLQEFSRSLAR